MIGHFFSILVAVPDLIFVFIHHFDLRILRIVELIYYILILMRLNVVSTQITGNFTLKSEYIIYKTLIVYIFVKKLLK